MIKFTVLGSGSTGNAVLISTEKTNVLVDAGLSAREILRRLALVGVNYSNLDAVLIRTSMAITQAAFAFC
jgi:Metal-dependent hydrolases of the beta-lactamase superfamily II